MHVLIVYASSEGQTEKISRFICDHLAAEGHHPTLWQAASGEAPVLARADRVLVAASLHVGAYQPAIRAFAQRHAAELMRRQAWFVSVSLTAAGSEPSDAAALEACIERLRRETGWIPARVFHLAGAFRYSRYGWLTRLALKWIAWQHGQSTDTSRDLELTDWKAVTRMCDELVGNASG